MIREFDWREPADIFAAVGDRPGAAFLDGMASGDPRAAFSFLCVDPVEEARMPIASLDDVETALRRLHRPSPSGPKPLPFAGGLIGIIGYAPGARHLTCLRTREAEPGLPDLVVRRYALGLGFDLAQKRMWGFAAPDIADADDRLAALLAAVRPPGASIGRTIWHEETPPAAHRKQIARVLDYIAAGDIYQANVTARFTGPRPPAFSPAAAYLTLRAVSPAPFGAFLDLGEGGSLISASPERFVQCDATGRIETRPIKGTLPRSADPEEDRAFADRLASSAKDIAENLMICDLLRNDLAKVAVAGSVEVPQLAALEGFASVWHLVSAVRAQLAPGRDAIDLLRETLPGGSITGAPKKRAIEIIDEVETSPRGPFYGTLFWLGEDGAMDSSLIIRSMVATPTRLIAAAGGGIVADSQPDAEYAELRTKIDPILEAFGAKP